MIDTPHTISDMQVRYLVTGYGGMCWTREWYRLLFSFALGRELALEEVDDVLARGNGFGPQRYEDTWEYLMSRADHESSNYWTNQV